jgi:thymidylate kinase
MPDDYSVRSNSWPILVAIEGPSGCGKSTLLTALEKELVEQRADFRVESNNDTGLWSGLIRSIARRPKAALTLALATAGARAELREGAIMPILCDRYVLSTFVYQRFAGISLEYLYAVNLPLLTQSVTFALTLDQSALDARRRERQSRRQDWFKEALDIRREIQLYDEAVGELQRRGHDIRIVDASVGTDVLARSLAAEISELLQAKA